ncbi:TPA: DUF4915 domain-containing protein, partial [Pseudomonas aeruginosa]
MFNFSDALLVSCPNGGGLYLIHNGQVSLLDNFNTTGFFSREQTLVRGIQPDELVIYGDTNLSGATDRIRVDDIHDIYSEDNYLFAVGTAANEIVKLTLDGKEVHRWVYPGEKDSWHINCLASWNGRIVFSAFGDFRRHREYKGCTYETGFVQDLLSGEILISGLSQPHSLVALGENLLVANSELMQVLEFSSTGKLLRTKQLDGYTRGICVGERSIYIGLSCSRNVENKNLCSAAVIELDRNTFEELGRFYVPSNEIYGIQRLESQNQAVYALSAVASLATSRLTEGLIERDGQITSLNENLAACNE